MSKNQDYTPVDQIVVSLAREINDYESCYTGIAIPSAVVAVQLARMTHAPNLQFFYGGYWINPDFDVDLFTIMTDTEAFIESISKAQGFSYLSQLYQYWEGPKHTLSFGFIRPAQIDQFGNINNSVIGDPKHPKFRFPGGAAAGDIINTCSRVIAYIPRQDTRTFVPNVDFITGKGSSLEWRKNIGLHNYQGIRSIVTDLAVLEFNPRNEKMCVRSIHEFSTVEEVQENTGFDLEIPSDVPITQAPTQEEMEILQTRADPLEIRNFDSRNR